MGWPPDGHLPCGFRLVFRKNKREIEKRHLRTWGVSCPPQFQFESDKKKGMGYLVQAVDHGLPRCEYSLGLGLIRGFVGTTNIEKDRKEGADLLLRSAEKGFLWSQYALGMHLLSKVWGRHGGCTCQCVASRRQALPRWGCIFFLMHGGCPPASITQSGLTTGKSVHGEPKSRARKSIYNN